jgi:hypothetical protein
MKKKLWMTIIMAASIFSLSSISPQKAQSRGGATCVASNMYFCRGCTLSQGRLNYKQINLCTDIIFAE